MKILVTGATGHIGAHSALALLAAGHQVRLLVRNAAAAERYFAAQGHAVDDIVVADIRERVKVRAAVRGCDGVLHAAALVSLDRGRAQEIHDNNLGGTQAVLDAACEAGVERIVYVSSLSAFAMPGLTVVDESAPLGQPREAYSISKRASEEYVRGLQAAGHPVQVTYPAGVVGPHDPKLSEANRGLVTMLGGMIPRTSTGMQCVDVRDLAQAHRFLLENPPSEPEAARYIVGGHYYPWAELHALLSRVTGRRIPSPPLPGAVLRAMGVMVDLARSVVPFETQMTADAMAIATQWVPADSSRYMRHSGRAFRPGEETFTDAVRWLASAGHLKARHAGRLAA